MSRNENEISTSSERQPTHSIATSFLLFQKQLLRLTEHLFIIWITLRISLSHAHTHTHTDKLTSSLHIFSQQLTYPLKRINTKL